VASSDEFTQLRLRFTDPLQHNYEIIRPVVLFSETIAERSRQTGIERTVVGDKAKRFIQQGMLGLQDQRIGKAGRKAHEYPDRIAAHILLLKQLYPPIHYREIVRIVEREFGYQTNHVTVKEFLNRHPIPVQLGFDFIEFHEYDDAYQARWTVVKMWAQGWNKKSIAGCLKLSRRQVGRIIEVFEREGFAGLEDQRTRPPNHPENQLTLPLFKEILDIQNEYPRAGRFRVHGLLEKEYQDQERDEKPPSEATVGRAMAINRQFHGAPGPWQSKKDEVEPDTTPKYLPFWPAYRHHIWYLDIRYLVQVDDRWVYSICLLEGYSRTILAGMASEHQDLTAVLQILYAALSEYGSPELIVSDNAKVFSAYDYRHILDTLAIEPKYIEKGRPWQNLIESQFKIQLRLADFKFEQAATVEAIQNLHAEFIETFNSTSHWAHRQRADGRRTPKQVLTWIRGRPVDLQELRRLFRRTRFIRTVNRHGFVSVQRFFIYAEQGLSRQRVSIWVYEGQLRIEYQETLLAQYQTEYDPRRKVLRDVSQPMLYETPFASPQLELFELDDQQWLKIRQRHYQRRQKRMRLDIKQLPLARLDVAIWLGAYLCANEVWENFLPNVGHFI
jgi:transposase InsO family protein/transposase